MKILLLVNPKSRQGAERFERIQQRLKELGHEVLNSEEDLKACSCDELISRYRTEVDCVAIGGGDGSINRALNALVRFQIPLHVIPLGTANNLARTLRVPLDLDENLRSLSALGETRVDLGVVNGLYFVNVAGVGLSSRVNREVSPDSKKWLGPWAFVLKAFGAIRRMAPFKVAIQHAQGLRLAYAWQVTVCNGRHYGPGLVASEDASLDDGLLDCISSEMKKWWHGLFHLHRFLRGHFEGARDIKLERSKEVAVLTSRPLPVDVDGDVLTHTPARFSVERARLRVLAPGSALG